MCTNALRKVKTCVCRVRDWLTFRKDTSSVKYWREGRGKGGWLNIHEKVHIVRGRGSEGERE